MTSRLSHPTRTGLGALLLAIFLLPCLTPRATADELRTDWVDADATWLLHIDVERLVDSALGSMGVGLPSAIAAALVRPDRQVLTVSGDGGFLMNVQELETAVRLDLDLVVMILNDSGLGMIRMKQHRDGYTQSNVDFGNPDFA